MRALRLIILVLAVLGGAVTIVKEWLEVKQKNSAPTVSAAPPAAPSQSTVVVVGSMLPAHSTPPPISTPGSAPPVDAGFNGTFVSNHGLKYLFEQSGPRIDVYILHPDGRRRYVGEAWDEGSVLRFKSFYSPVYEEWGNFPPMRRRGNTLVATTDDGSEMVFFTREIS
ncbi:MAG TPA: hypothetical protein VHW00_22680 [Thermoanaerobaculia bacterium]|nr:hypothetical protein [Thermoanaerobaculia bacterium]